ncbi:hypothetical protein RDI58_018902 [Solanum bulbocastanum]|uniref:F-box domain-containing protein n=1 Tax=Solanum bulbocastanum TaxID=147425 RepID=A0AAN8THS7_SOLBU
MDAKNPSSAISRTSHFPKPQRRNQKEVHVRVIANEEGKYEVSPTKFMDLPREIMVEILSRLPIKSTFRVKMVCTSFYDIFSDPLFVLMHHTRSPFPCILFSNYHSVYSILELKSDYDYNSCPKINPIMLNNEFHLPQLMVKVVNGETVMEWKKLKREIKEKMKDNYLY